MKPDRDTLQTVHRLRVGMAGLVAVALLIAVAGWIIGSTDREQPANRAVEIAAGPAGDNAAAEPLAELGATPGTINDQVASVR